MGKMIFRLSVAAHYFAQGVTTSAYLSKAVGCSRSRIYAYVKNPLWKRALAAFGYEGDGKLTAEPSRDPTRNSPDLVRKAKDTYIEVRNGGGLIHQAVSVVCEQIPILSRRRVHTWKRRYQWEALVCTPEKKPRRRYKLKCVHRDCVTPLSEVGSIKQDAAIFPLCAVCQNRVKGKIVVGKYLKRGRKEWVTACWIDDFSETETGETGC